MRKIILPKPTNLIVPERRIFVPRAPSRYRQRGFMRLMPSIGIWGRRGDFVVDAADFDGTNDFMSRGALSGVINSKVGTFSAWIKGDSFANAPYLFRMHASGLPFFSELQLFVNTSGGLKFDSYDASNSPIAEWTSTNILGTSVWHHIASSWDVGANVYQFYVDGVNRLSTGARSQDAAMDYTGATAFNIGSTPGGGTKFNGGMAEFYLNVVTRLDFSVAANLLKFRTASGKPANLGVNGEFPTGATPNVFQHLNDGETATNFATNRGSGGNFSITGALTTFPTSPSD